MKKILNYVLVAIAVVNIVLASATVVDVKIGAGNKVADIILIFLYVIIATLDLTYIIFKDEKNK